MLQSWFMKRGEREKFLAKMNEIHFFLVHYLYKLKSVFITTYFYDFKQRINGYPGVQIYRRNLRRTS